MKTCCICVRPVNAPYRLHNIRTGKIIEGCIAADHDGQLAAGSKDEQWHNRPVAVGVRMQIEQRRKALIGE